MRLPRLRVIQISRGDREAAHQGGEDERGPEGERRDFQERKGRTQTTETTRSGSVSGSAGRRIASSARSETRHEN